MLVTIRIQVLTRGQLRPAPDLVRFTNLRSRQSMCHAPQLLGQDVPPLMGRGHPHFYLPVKSARAAQCGIQRVGPVSGRYHHNRRSCIDGRPRVGSIARNSASKATSKKIMAHALQQHMLATPHPQGCPSP